MSLTKYERGNTIKASVEFKSSGVYADPLYPKINVYKPDGSKLVDNGTPLKDDTGKYHYYIETSSDDPLGIYIIEWTGWQNLGGVWGSGQLVQRDVFQLVEVD